MTIRYKPLDLKYTDKRMLQYHQARRIGVRGSEFARDFGLNADRLASKYCDWKRRAGK